MSKITKPVAAIKSLRFALFLLQPEQMSRDVYEYYIANVNIMTSRYSYAHKVLVRQYILKQNFDWHKR